MYDWMTVDGLLGFVGRYRPGWDRELATRLRERFRLAPDRRVGELSKAGLGFEAVPWSDVH